MNHLPQPIPERQGDVWGRFSADPRQHAATRASDADRDVAASVLAAAYSDGRLDHAEHDERLGAAMQAKTLGDLAPLLRDITVAGHPAPIGLPDVRPWLRRKAVVSWLALAALFNTIWLMTVLTRGRLMYYWPMWPMWGTAIPVVLALVFGGKKRTPKAQLDS